MEVEVEPTLEQEIHKGQLEDEKIKEIAELITIGNQIFDWMIRELCGSEREYVC